MHLPVLVNSLLVLLNARHQLRQVGHKTITLEYIRGEVPLDRSGDCSNLPGRALAFNIPATTCYIDSSRNQSTTVDSEV